MPRTPVPRPIPRSEEAITSRARRIRHHLKISQMQLAAYAGVSNSTVLVVEKGLLSVKLESIFRISRALGVSPIDLYPALNTRPAHPVMTPPRPMSAARARRVQGADVE